MEQEIIEILKSTNREGIDNLISFMQNLIFLKHQQVLDFMVIMKEDF